MSDTTKGPYEKIQNPKSQDWDIVGERSKGRNGECDSVVLIARVPIIKHSEEKCEANAKMIVDALNGAEEIKRQLELSKVHAAVAEMDVDQKRAVIDVMTDGHGVADEDLWECLKNQRDRALAELRAATDKINTMQGQLVYGFYEDPVPVYVQGDEKLIDLHELVTAGEINSLVQKVVEYEEFFGDVQAGCDIARNGVLYRQVPVVKAPGLTQAESELTTLRERLATVERERDEALGIIARLPKTVDGVPACPGDTIYMPGGEPIQVARYKTTGSFPIFVRTESGELVPTMACCKAHVEACYSTAEAAALSPAATTTEAGTKKGLTCKQIAEALGDDQAKTMGIPFSDQLFDDWVMQSCKPTPSKCTIDGCDQPAIIGTRACQRHINGH